MTNLTGGTIGFYLEDTGIGGGGSYGVRLWNATPANTVVYAFGEMIGSFPMPVELPSWIDRDLFSSYDFGALKAGAKQVDFELGYLLMEGVSLYFPLGKEAKSGSTPDITHVLTGIEPSDGNELPSRTIHGETTGLTTQKRFDISGCITTEMDIGGSRKETGIKIREKITGQRITDENATTDRAGVASAGSEDDAPDLAAPVYADNTGLTVEDFYYLEHIKHETVNITSHMEAWNINIKNEMLIRRSNSSGTDNYNRSMNNYVGAQYLKKRRYTVTLNLLANDATKILWDRMQDGTQDNTLEFKFTRRRASDNNVDVITIAFHATIAPVLNITGLVNLQTANDQNWTISLSPKSIVSCTVVDDVNEYQELHE